MTEEEAKKKWCPILARDGGGLACIASGCMMWRWTAKYAEASMWPNQGCCGLAGKPEYD